MILPAPGILLIAHPFLKDPNFLKTVVLLCEHNKAGSLGFVLNKKITPTLDELVDGFNGIKLPVFSGGPMEPEKLFFIHQCPDLIPDSLKISTNIYWGGNFETLTSLIINKHIDFNKIKFFVGYSGWDNGQLKDELEEKSWVTVEATVNLVYNSTPAAVWKDSLKYLGDGYELMVNFPTDPQLN